MPDPVIKIATQLHGYRKGHELLDGSPLSKADQGLVDRLSDLAGPLRPGEKFKPYITGYPLPSKQFYVLARTWQDLIVARAGCVRTLSLIVPMEEWARSGSVGSYFSFLNERMMPEEAEPAQISSLAIPFSPIIEFDGREMLEALFLEDSRPVVVFDAPQPELIAVRLLSALWPGLRERFSISTFALSPRKIEGKSFDLVFAPKDVKARFTNWQGRRIDSNSESSTRHRWTSAMVDRVFKDVNPRLLDDHSLEALALNELTAPSALRISFLWDELLQKLRVSPSAALGLLDVANSKFSASAAAKDVLPLLANAAVRAANEMEPSDGWAFVAAMLRKVQDTPFSSITSAIADAGRVLAHRDPGKAISFLEQPDPAVRYAVLMPRIAAGLYDAFHEGAEEALIVALPETLAYVLQENSDLANSVVLSPAMLSRIEQMVRAVSPLLFDRLRGSLLPLLHNADQMDLAAVFLMTLSFDQLIDEIEILSQRSDVPDRFAHLLVSRARALNGESIFREKALDNYNSNISRQILNSSLMPTSADVSWILDRLPANLKEKHLTKLLLTASSQQLTEIFADQDLARRIVPAIDGANVALLMQIASDVWLPLDLLVAIVQSFKGRLVSADAFARLARHALQRCLRENFVEDEIIFLLDLLKASPGVDAGWLIHNGLAGHVTSSVVSRNIRMFDALDAEMRLEIVKSIDDIGKILAGRWYIDLDTDSSVALTNLLDSSGHQDKRTTLRASAYLLPALMRSKDWPISPIIAVTFPYVYAELAREDDVPDLFRFIPFFDWDRCKAARHEVVDAFLSADQWRPVDLAHTACRCGEAERFINRLTKDVRGRRYAAKINYELSTLPNDCARKISDLIANITR